MTSESEFFSAPGAPPQHTPPSIEIFNSMGESNIYKMFEDFYKELESSSIRPFFQEDMLKASRKPALFFIGLFGGPKTYQEKYGPPDIKVRHLPFPIDDETKEVWLGCFNQVLDKAVDEYNFPEEHLEVLKTYLKVTADWVVNTNP